MPCTNRSSGIFSQAWIHDRFADHVGGRVAEEAFGDRVVVADAIIQVGRNYRHIERRSQDAAEVGGFPLQFLLRAQPGNLRRRLGGNDLQNILPGCRQPHRGSRDQPQYPAGTALLAHRYAGITLNAELHQLLVVREQLLSIFRIQQGALGQHIGARGTAQQIFVVVPLPAVE